MSSITAHESDNLSIVIAEGEWIVSATDAGDNKNIKTIRIHTSILVNGRIKNLYNEFAIEKKHYTDPSSATTAEEESELLSKSRESYWYTLIDWTAWNTFLELLQQLGYANDISYRDIEAWIGKLYSA